uniref:Uncharacterized protein n=1 Tax=Nelumbo nucifera TaxID=4432 RepID=A0A822Y1Q4_NELNU|nr:TPA_asm: hypothetical protein HUJ06_029292 [Nelumbo nucifera]
MEDGGGDKLSIVISLIEYKEDEVSYLIQDLIVFLALIFFCDLIKVEDF